MQDKPTVPTPPFKVREYATLEREDAIKVFSLPELHRSWGLLHCEDAEGRHYTAFGDYSYCQALRKLDGGSGIGKSGDRDAVAGFLNDEFPSSEFKAQFLAPGWPDEWRSLGVLPVWPTKVLQEAYERATRRRGL
jgi:hypothetical protein